MYTISASNVKEFQQAEELLKKLPESILDQIDEVKHTTLLTKVIFKKVYGGSKITLPNSIKNLNEAETYFTASTDDFCFIIPFDQAEKALLKISYTFIKI